jgi:hypothetical protein
MNLRYKMSLLNNNYDINCPNIVFYRYCKLASLSGQYKKKWFGLDFWPVSKIIRNELSGITINY